MAVLSFSDPYGIPPVRWHISHKLLNLSGINNQQLQQFISLEAAGVSEMQRLKRFLFVNCHLMFFSFDRR